MKGLKGSRATHLSALFIGACLIGFVPILMRFSEVGPVSTAMWRMLFASFFIGPLLFYRGFPGFKGRGIIPFSLAGVFFAVDLIFFHLSIMMTSVSNASFLNNMAPIFAGIILVFMGRRVGGAYWAGVVVALMGMLLLILPDLKVNSSFLGNLWGVISAVFFAFYLITGERARERYTAFEMLFFSGLVSAFVLIVFAMLSDEQVIPVTLNGWGVLIGMALVCHCCGQALVIYALGKLNTAVVSLGMLLQAVMAGLYSVFFFEEFPVFYQVVGAVVIILGIAIAIIARRKN